MATLPRHEVLWRRVPRVQIQADGTAQSGAFRSKSGVCVHRAALTTLAVVSSVDPNAHVYQFTVGDALDAGATDVTDDRLPTESPDHAMVFVPSSGAAKRLKQVARRVYPP